MIPWWSSYARDSVVTRNIYSFDVRMDSSPIMIST